MNINRAFACVITATALLMCACTAALVGPQPATSNANIFDAIWRDFDRYYAFFDIRGVDWNVESAHYRPLAVQASTNAELASVIGDMFTDLHDEHVDLFVPPGTYHRSVDFTQIHTYFDPVAIAAKYLTGRQMTPSRNIAYAMLAPDVGYVWVATFGGSGWPGEIDGVLNAMPAARFLVIDLRNNDGGSSSNADIIAARFADARRLFAYERFRNGPGHSDFGGDIAQTIAPGGAARFTGPVAVLVNRGVVSASEHFVLAMRVRPHTVFVGDTTAGAMGNPMIRELANGWTYRVPQGQERGPARESYEGVGIAPGVLVRHSAADSAAARDPQLEAAIVAVRAAGQ